MDNRKDKEMYQQIVNKLGFEPKNYKPTLKNMENDNENNPFDILTLEELKYLKRNNYFINIDMEN